jgi:hypothetical protein
LKADQQVVEALSPAELESLFDLDYHLKHVDAIFARVFAPEGAPSPLAGEDGARGATDEGSLAERGMSNVKHTRRRP